VLRQPAGAVAVAAPRKPLVIAVAAAAKMASVTTSGEERGKTLMEEMRAVAMGLHTRDQSRHGEKVVPLEPPVATWKPTIEGFLLFLADNKLVFETLEAVVGRAAIPWCE
jgi:heme oxygenase